MFRDLLIHFCNNKCIVVDYIWPCSIATTTFVIIQQTMNLSCKICPPRRLQLAIVDLVWAHCSVTQIYSLSLLYPIGVLHLMLGKAYPQSWKSWNISSNLLGFILFTPILNLSPFSSASTCLKRFSVIC